MESAVEDGTLTDLNLNLSGCPDGVTLHPTNSRYEMVFNSSSLQGDGQGRGSHSSVFLGVLGGVLSICSEGVGFEGRAGEG
jgi:hypothetical protein